MRTTDAGPRPLLRVLPACGLLAAVLALAACGGDDQGTAAGGATPGVTDLAVAQEPGEAGSVPDPCGLLTEEEVAAAIGEAKATAEPGRGGQPSGTQAASCSWTGPPPTAGAIATPKMVVLDIYEGAQYFASAHDGEPVSGVGDDAFLLPPLDSIFWLQGDLVLQLQYVVLDGTPAAELESLAAKAAGRVG